MSSGEFKYLYGPVYSWRLGMSLGIDPLSKRDKVCNMDCTYCQLGKTSHLTLERQDYVPVASLLDEILRLPDITIDHLTFSGRGEPTLAKNLGEMIRALKSIRREKIAVITNSLLIGYPEVQEDLQRADVVLAKLDVSNNDDFRFINRSWRAVDFSYIVKSLMSFRKFYKGKLALQIMLMAENKARARELGEIARMIEPDEVQLNTPTRPNGVKALHAKDLNELKQYFKGMPVISVFDEAVKDYQPFNDMQTKLRHGNYKNSYGYSKN